MRQLLVLLLIVYSGIVQSNQNIPDPVAVIRAAGPESTRVGEGGMKMNSRTMPVGEERFRAIGLAIDKIDKDERAKGACQRLGGPQPNGVTLTLVRFGNTDHSVVCQFDIAGGGASSTVFSVIRVQQGEMYIITIGRLAK